MVSNAEEVDKSDSRVSLQTEDLDRLLRTTKGSKSGRRLQKMFCGKHMIRKV